MFGKDKEMGTCQLTFGSFVEYDSPLFFLRPHQCCADLEEILTFCQRGDKSRMDSTRSTREREIDTRTRGQFTVLVRFLRECNNLILIVSKDRFYAERL